MTNTTREQSWQDGYPVEYYEFLRDTLALRYNTSDRVLPLNGEDWMPLAISRGRIAQGAERNKLTLTVTVPRTSELFDWWHPYPTSLSVGMTIYTSHVGEVGSPLVSWIGRVMSPKFSPEAVTLMCEPSTTTNRKTGQIQSWQRNCMHVLYKQGHGLCNANKDDFAVPATISFSSGVVIKSTAFAAVADGRLRGGYFEWTTPSGITERRSIHKHVGDTLTLLHGTSELPVSTVGIAYPGCKRTWDDCDTFFNNGVNYGGDLYAPERSPFNGQPVF